jgi:type IV pilus assembly protein PilM
MGDYEYRYGDESPAEPPSSGAPGAEPPTYEPPASEPPGYETPTYESASYEAPAYEAPAGELPGSASVEAGPHAVDRPAEPASEEEREATAAEPDASEYAAAHEPDEASPESVEQEPEPDSPATPPAPSEPERRRRLALKRERSPKTKRGKSDAKNKPLKKVVGLKIGASQIAAARVVNNGAPELVEFAREPLDPGVVVAGEIRDTEALAAALQGFFERHKLPKKGIRLGISNNRIGVRVFEIEGVEDERQLENAIRFRAEEVLPIPLDQAVLDYVVLDEGEDAAGSPLRRILLVVAYREVVDRYLEACRGAGLEVVGVDLEAFALLRSLAAPAQRDPGEGALVAVAVGHDRTTIAVSNGRVCEFTRVLDWGGWSLNVAVARELDMAPSEVEGIKRQLSFATESPVDGLPPERVAKARDGVQRALAAFARELVASLHFYQAQPGALGIGEIVVTGGTTHMDGFAEALGRVIGVPVRLGNPFGRVKSETLPDDSEQTGSLAVAIGLGIED